MEHRSQRPGAAAEWILRGRGFSPGLAAGPLARNHPGLEPDDARGTILVSERAVPDDVARIEAAAGTLTLGGAPLSHLSRVSRELGKPALALAQEPGIVLSPPGAGEILRVPGDDRVARTLHSGDVVLLDADRGLLRVPGGHAARRRDRVRELWRALGRAAAAPGDPGRLSDAARCAGDDPALTRFVLEVAAVHRLLPAGDAVRRLIDLLRGHVGSASIDAICRGLAAEIGERAELAARRALATLDDTRDPRELERCLADARDRIAAHHERLRDLGGEPDRAAPLLKRIGETAARRREELARGLEREVQATLALDPQAFSARSSTCRVLVRNAAAAGVAAGPLGRLSQRLERELERQRGTLGGRLALSLDEPGLPGRGLVGAKAAGLFRVRAALPDGCGIPPGFVLTTTAYRLHLAGEPETRLAAALAEPEHVMSRSRRARAVLLEAEPPPAVVDAIGESLSALGLAGPLAVRSSTTLEDGPGGSLAGQFDTYLGVRGPDEVLAAVRRCWSSLWGAAALRALEAGRIPAREAAAAVIVQQLVETRAAGVLLTRDPAGDPGAVLINAVRGLGEAVSRGELRGELYRVGRETGKLLTGEPATERTRIALDPRGAGTVEVPLAADAIEQPCLDARDLDRLAALARAVERSCGEGRDVEFGIAEHGAVLVFQVRPIATGRVGPGGERSGDWLSSP